MIDITKEVTTRSHAPWTDDQVESLNGFQHCGYLHEFRSERDKLLVATNLGWVEEGTTTPIVQTWAHEFMTNWEWCNMRPFSDVASQTLDQVIKVYDPKEVADQIITLGSSILRSNIAGAMTAAIAYRDKNEGRRQWNAAIKKAIQEIEDSGGDNVVFHVERVKKLLKPHAYEVFRTSKSSGKTYWSMVDANDVKEYPETERIELVIEGRLMLFSPTTWRPVIE